MISLGGIVVSRSIRIGGDEMDQDIVLFARREYNLLLGERTAEDIKIAIGSASPGEWDVAARQPARPRPADGPAALGRGRGRPDPRGDRAVGLADRRDDQGHDRGDAARAGRRHHGPGHRAGRRRRAAGRPRPAHRRGDPDAGPRRRRPADLRRPRHRDRARGARDDGPRAGRRNVLRGPRGNRAAARPARRRDFNAGGSLEPCSASSPIARLRRRGLVYAALLSISLVLMAFSSTPVVGEVQGGLAFAFRPVQAVFCGGRPRRRRRSSTRSPRSASCARRTSSSSPRTSGSPPRTRASSSSAARTRSSPRCSSCAAAYVRDGRGAGHRRARHPSSGG